MMDRLPRALDYARINTLNDIVQSGPDDRIGIVTSGKTYLDLREALSLFGLGPADLRRYGIRILKLGMIYPVDPEIVHRFAAGLGEIIVLEEKRAFLETAVRDILYRRANAPVVIGKTDPNGKSLVNIFGELDADLIANALGRRLGDEYCIEPVQQWKQRPRTSKIALPLLNRTPYFCSGCPHNSSTKVAPDTLIGGGIGCHAMVMMMDDKQVGDVIGLTQMGGEGAQWIGMAPFLERTTSSRTSATARSCTRAAWRCALPSPPEKHDLQAALQRHRRHDRRAGPGRRHAAGPDHPAAPRRRRREGSGHHRRP